MVLLIPHNSAPYDTAHLQGVSLWLGTILMAAVGLVGFFHSSTITQMGLPRISTSTRYKIGNNQAKRWSALKRTGRSRLSRVVTSIALIFWVKLMVVFDQSQQLAH